MPSGWLVGSTVHTLVSGCCCCCGDGWRVEVVKMKSRKKVIPQSVIFVALHGLTLSQQQHVDMCVCVLTISECCHLSLPPAATDLPMAPQISYLRIQSLPIRFVPGPGSPAKSWSESRPHAHRPRTNDDGLSPGR